MYGCICECVENIGHGCDSAADKKYAAAADKMLMSRTVGAACATWHTGKSADMNALETLRNTQYCTGHVEIGEFQSTKR